MNIEEVKKLKADTEEEILDVINKFKKLSGLEVNYVNLETYAVSQDGSQYIAKVKLDVAL